MFATAFLYAARVVNPGMAPPSWLPGCQRHSLFKQHRLFSGLLGEHLAPFLLAIIDDAAG
jgi:hypothetical protein